MSSVDEIRKEIEENKKFARMTQNETSKMEYRKNIENLTMQLREAERKAGKKQQQQPQQPQQPPKKEEPKKEEPKKEEFNDINRGKVAEPGSSIPENKSEGKQSEDKDQNNHNHNRK